MLRQHQVPRWGDPIVKLDLAKATFTPSMALRAGTTFATAPIIQGKRDGTGTSDVLVASAGSTINGYFYQNIDKYQGSIVFRITPEWSGNDSLNHYIYCDSSYTFRIYKTSSNYLTVLAGSINYVVDISTWIAGSTYCVVIRWDSKNSIDGTNHICTSINDVHSFQRTSGFTPDSASTLIFGSYYNTIPANAIIEGLTIYRRPLWDGTYGVNVGNGDEINLIYAAGAGKDPCEITGMSDVVFVMPGNGTPGALTTGNGNAWSAPHSSNLLTRGWLNDGGYLGDDWAVAFNGTSTVIDCGSDAGLDDLADNAFTAEGWFRAISSGEGGYAKFIDKSGLAVGGWSLYFASTSQIRASVYCATTSAEISASYTPDSKWHHFAITFDDAGDRKVRIYIDGVLSATSSAGSGAIISDAALNLLIGNRSDNARTFDGSIGWVRVSDSIRYSANFVPSRTPPAPDANTIGQWNMSEGTGATVDNAEGTAARDGTISNGTWERQWYQEGTPIVPTSLEFNGTTTNIVCGNDASINDLADNAFTAEGWFRLDSPGEDDYGRLLDKANKAAFGWTLATPNSSSITAVVYCATTWSSAVATFSPNKRQRHIAITWDDAGDRKVRIYVDGILVQTGNAGVGAISSDAAISFCVGNVADFSRTMDGAVGWVRLSDSVRYVANFTPPSRVAPPAVDGNTVLQLNMTEGAGTTATDSSGNANHGTITAGVWNNTPDMAVDSPGARVYNWGSVLGSGAAHSGQAQLYTVVAGNDYSLRALGYSEDGIGQPEIIVYDESNAATIVTVLGTVASTESAPNVLETSFEAPAGCTLISVKIVNAIDDGVVGWNQCELYANLWDDPGMETGTAYSNHGTPTTNAQSNEQAHSGTYSWKVVTDAANEGAKRTLAGFTVGKFYRISVWTYSSDLSTNRLYFIGGVIQASGSSYSGETPGSDNTWTKTQLVVRATSTSITIHFYSNASGTTFYFDDIVVQPLDDVSLTCTPRSLANSTEDGGVCVDGMDKLTMPIPAGRLKASKGELSFYYTPRHGIADALKYGWSHPYITYVYADANNFFYVDCFAIDTLRLAFNAGGAGGVTATANITGQIVAGTTYLISVKYTASGMVLKVNGVVKISISSPCIFTTIPTLAHFGSTATPSYQADAVFS